MPEKNVIERTTMPMTDTSLAEQLPRIESISDHLDLVPTIASWHWKEWGHADPKGTLERWTEGLRQRTKPDAIPTTYVAFSKRNEPIGSVVLVENDMSTHPELTPWLAGLFVLTLC